MNTGQADAGLGIELSAIAAIVIGGTSIVGGEEAVWRSVSLGVMLLAIMGDELNLLGLNPTYRSAIVQGSIILVAIAIDARSRSTV